MSCKLVLKQKAFRSIPVWRLLGPISEVCGVLSNKNLSSTLLGQRPVIEIDYVLGVTWTVLTTQKSHSHALIWGFY